MAKGVLVTSASRINGSEPASCTFKLDALGTQWEIATGEPLDDAPRLLSDGPRRHLDRHHGAAEDARDARDVGDDAQRMTLPSDSEAAVRGRLVDARDQDYENLEPATLDRSGLLRGALVGATGLLLGGTLASAGHASPVSARRQREDAQGGAAAKRKVLIAYFSRPGENYYYGRTRDIKVGNTQVLAKMIADHIDADVYRIRAANPYPHSYSATVARNVREQNADARPRIANPLKSIEDYDVVLLGSPIWNVRPPMIMSTFAESFDFSGKTIHPFVTYAVSGLGTTIETYAALSTGARITAGLAVRGERVRRAEPQVRAWLRRISLVR